MLTEKQILVLFLIATNPKCREIYTLVKIFDRVDFPSEMTEIIEPLLQKNLIFVAENFDNGTAKSYQITEEGQKFINQNFDTEKTLDYIKTMNEPKFLLEIMEPHVDNKNNS